MTQDGSSLIPDPSQEGHALADLPLPTSGQVAGVVLIEANVWQGTWPADNRLMDGYFYTSPVGRFAPDTIGAQRHDWQRMRVDVRLVRRGCLRQAA